MALAFGLVHLTAVAAAAALLQAAPAPPGPSPAPRTSAASRRTPAPAPSAILEGLVKGPDGKPVDQALVVARAATASFSDPPRTARTSPEGRFRIEVTARGPHTVRVEARGLAARTVEKAMPGGAPLAIALAKGGFIEGVVKDGATGQTVPAARVEAREVAGAIGAPWEAGAGLVDATSDDKGRFRLEGLASGRHTVTGSARGFGRATHGNVALGQRVELFLTAGASIAGTVRDPAGRPVQGAVVRVEPETRGLSMPPTSRTGRDGRYDVFGLGAGTHRVLVHHPEFAPALAAGISVEMGTETGADVTLERGVPVVGRMVDPAREPASGQVVLADLDGAPARSFSSVVRADAGPDGRFQVARLPVGSHVLTATAPGFVPRRVEAEVRRADAKVDLGDVTMEAGHAIRGRVTTSSAAPIAGARVIGFPSRGGMGMAGFSGPLEASTDAEGRFVVAALTPGAYRLQIEAPGHAPGRQVADAGGPEVQIVLTAAGTIKGSVVDERARPLEGAFASAEAARADGEMRVVMSPNRRPSSEDGRFVLENLAAATYVVTVSAPDRVRKVVSDVQVAAGASVDVGTLRMDPGATLRGTVVDGTGTAVLGAVVRIQGASEAFVSFQDDPAATTDAAGAFELRGTTPETVEVYARHPMHAEGRASATIDSVKGAEVRIVMGDGGRVAGLARRRDGPIAGAMISVQPVGGGRSGWNPALQTSTGPDGTFTVEHVPPGRNRVALLERSGGERFASSQMKEVEVVEGETVRLEFAPRDIVMAGRVTRGGVSVPNLRISVSMHDASGGTMVLTYGPGAPGSATIGPQRMAAVTGEDGRYEMLVDHVGKAGAGFASLDGRGAYPMQTFEVPDAESHTQDFDLPTATLTGTVVDGDTQQPVARASVTASSREPALKWAGNAETGPDGRFTVSVEPGDYRLSARAEGYAVRSVEASAGSSATDLTIALERGVPIAGRVLDARGTPVAGAMVTASVPDKDDLRMDSAQTLADGSFRLEGVTDGAYNLAASTENGGWAILPEVRAGTSNVVLRLRPWARVRVRVVDAGGQPVARAFVGVERVDGQRVAFWSRGGGMTTADGIAELRVPAGAVELRARSETLSGTVQAAATEDQAAEVEITVTETRPAGSP